MNFIGIGSSARVYPFLFRENQIVERLAHSFGDRFSNAFKQYGSLAVVWRECLDWELMRCMLQLSAHGSSHFRELCELARSQDKERGATGVSRLDVMISRKRVVLEDKYVGETDSKERVAYEVWEFVWCLVDMWTRDACKRALDEAIFGRDAYMISMQQSFMQAQADRLRKLIPNPFVPNMEPMNGVLE